MDNRRMSKVREILKSLIAQKNISEWKLSEETGIPQSTISAITIGRSKEQRDSTLQPIADYFGITLAQLRGYEPIENIGGDSLSKEAALSNHYPVLSADQIQNWLEGTIKKTELEEFETSFKTEMKTSRTFVYVSTDDSLAGLPGLGEIGQRYFIDPDSVTEKARNESKSMIIALIRVKGQYSLRMELNDFGDIRYKAVNDGYRPISASECELIGHVVAIPERTWKT